MSGSQTPQTEQERLIARLTTTPGLRLEHLSLTRGTGPATVEEVCREINSALDQEESGRAVISTSFRDETPQVNVREWLAGLEAAS